jgi:PAS domain S-box-containing protein
MFAFVQTANRVASTRRQSAACRRGCRTNPAWSLATVGISNDRRVSNVRETGSAVARRQVAVAVGVQVLAYDYSRTAGWHVPDPVEVDAARFAAILRSATHGEVTVSARPGKQATPVIALEYCLGPVAPPGGSVHVNWSSTLMPSWPSRLATMRLAVLRAGRASARDMTIASVDSAPPRRRAARHDRGRLGQHDAASQWSPREGARIEVDSEPPSLPQAQSELEFFDLALDLMVIVGFDGYFKRVNAAYERTLGDPLRELLSRPALEFVHPEDLPTVRDQLREFVDGKHVNGVEHRVICGDGSVRWFQWNTRTVPERGVVFAVGRDVTDRRRADLELREAHRMVEASRAELAASRAHRGGSRRGAQAGVRDLHDGAQQRLVHSGLLGLADRLAALNGQLAAESPTDGGTLIAAAIPIGGSDP